MRHEELVSMAELAAKRLEIGFDRDAGKAKDCYDSMVRRELGRP
jgi:hypothetical protein